MPVERRPGRARDRASGGVPLLAAQLGSDFDVDEEALLEAVRRRKSDTIFFSPDVVKIDLYVRGGTPFDDSELSRRRRQDIREGEAVFVATPEDNVLRKLLWFRMGGDVSDRQWRDVLGILRISAPLDWGYLQLWAERLQIGDLLERARSQA